MSVIKNRNKVIIEYRDGAVTISYILEDKDGEKYELFDEVYSVQKFMDVYNVSSEEDIQLIDKSCLWLRYLDEAAELIYTNDDGNTIHFRKLRNKTMVYSLDLNCYSEIFKVLNMTEQFAQFIEEHQEQLESISYKN